MNLMEEIAIAFVSMVVGGAIVYVFFPRCCED